MIRPSLISSITPLPQYGIRPTLISTESFDQGESNGTSCKGFGGELTKDFGFYWRINYSALIRFINTFYFWLCFHWPPLPYTKGFPSVLDHFQWGLESFWDRNTGFVSIISWVWHGFELESLLLSQFVTPDWVTDHVMGQVTCHRPFLSLSMFVCVCLHMFGHLTFFGHCI